MWKSSIIINHSSERALQELGRRLEGIKGLCCATARTPAFAVYRLACNESDVLYVRSLVENAVCDAIFYQYKYGILRRAAARVPMSAGLCALLSALLSYDAERERTLILSVLSEQNEYVPEGVMHFRLRGLMRAWHEVADMVRSLLRSPYEESDLYSVALYMQENRESDVRLFISDSTDLLITNAKEGSMVEICPLYDDPVFNAVHTVVAQGAKEVIVQGKRVDKRLLQALENIVRIKVL